MRLITCTSEGKEFLGAWVNGDREVLALATASLLENPRADSANYQTLQALIDGGPRAWDAARELVARENAGALMPTSRCRLRTPIQPVQLRDFLSFPEHVKGCRATLGEWSISESADPEAKRAQLVASGFFDVPKGYYDYPVYYISNRMAMVDPGETVQWPEFSGFIDYELEWAAVIGKEGHKIRESDAAGHIFGYTIFNDWSARDEQMKVMGGPVNLGPGAGKDFANTIGPCVVTADELPDPYSLRMEARINGVPSSSGNTASMHYRFEQLLEYLTRSHAVYPGEVLGSGTVGSGCCLETRKLISPGDVIELEIERIGVLRNRVEAPHIAAQGERGFSGAMMQAMRGAIKA